MGTRGTNGAAGNGKAHGMEDVVRQLKMTNKLVAASLRHGGEAMTQQEIVKLLGGTGATTQEIAEVLDTSPNTIRKAQIRLRKKA